MFHQNKIFCLIFTCMVSSEIIMHTKLGEIKGISMLSRKGNKFNAFLGIPYAKPPIGKLRFQNPQLYDEPWSGTLDATKDPPICPQLNGSDMFVGNEDCLYMNVFVPKVNSKKALPVWVFIYGGRRISGHASPNKHGPHYIMDKPVVFVTFAYRINILGFLSTEDDIIPGNYGLKDEAIALKWIQKHIAFFNGDPTNVTISGGSTGGIDVGLHLCSPLSKGFFHRAISQSGHPLQTVSPPYKMRKQTWILANHLGCSEKRSEELIICLQKLPVEILVESTIWKLRDLPAIQFSPVIESKHNNQSFLIDYPQNDIKKPHNEPWLMGINQDEGSIASIAFFKDPMRRRHLSENLKNSLPKLMGYQILRNRDKITDSLLQKYFQKPDEWFSGVSKVFGMIYFFVGAINCALDYNGRKYFYVYNHENKINYGRNYYFRGLYTKEKIGASHGEELRSLQHYPSKFPPITEGEDLIMSEKIISLWYNFVKSGNPNDKNINIWRPVADAELEYLYIHGTKLEMRKKPFWDDYLLFRNITQK